MLWRLLTCLSLLALIGIGTSTASASESLYMCQPTLEDEEGPLYRPNAAVRNEVGKGYLVMGTVKSAADCKPLINARIEVWMAGPEGHYGDHWRATLFSDQNGNYYFRSHVPPNYGTGRAHIHIKAFGDGYKTLTTQHYPAANAGEAIFDLVLVPD